jgi:hypothetical protein
MHRSFATDKPSRGEQANPASGFEAADLLCCGNDIQLNLSTERPFWEKAMPIPPFGHRIFGVPQEDGFKFRSFARQTNSTAIEPIINVAMKMLYQLHTDKCED